MRFVAVLWELDLDFEAVFVLGLEDVLQVFSVLDSDQLIELITQQVLQIVLKRVFFDKKNENQPAQLDDQPFHFDAVALLAWDKRPLVEHPDEIE